MKLTDLEPEFVQAAPAEGLHFVDTLEDAQGVMFDCPKCGGHRLLTWFKQPIRLPPVAPDLAPGPGRWGFTGSGMENLTLNPSIDAGCWHGWIQEGVVTS